MRPQSKDINRKWLNRLYKSSASRSVYFTGGTPREIAHSIVRAEGLHPAYVGKLDQLIGKLMKQKVYTISTAGTLVRCERSYTVLDRTKKDRRHQALRLRRQRSQRERDLHTAWQAEALA